MGARMARLGIAWAGRSQRGVPALVRFAHVVRSLTSGVDRIVALYFAIPTK